MADCELSPTKNIVNNGGVVTIELTNPNTTDMEVVFVTDGYSPTSVVIAAGQTESVPFAYPLCYTWNCPDEMTPVIQDHPASVAVGELVSFTATGCNEYWWTVNGLVAGNNNATYNRAWAGTQTNVEVCVACKMTGEDFADVPSDRFVCCPVFDVTEAGAKSITLDCPTATITDPNQPFTIGFTDNDPPVAPDTRNYKLLINSASAGPSVPYPTQIITSEQNISTYTTGTNGTFLVELRCFDNGDTDAIETIETCVVNYEYPILLDHEAGLRFSEIEVTAPDNFHFTTDKHYVAQYLYENIKNGTPVCFWDIVTLDDGEKCVIPVPPPEPDNPAPTIPAPSGGDDRAMLQAAYNGGGQVVGTGAVYSVGGTISINNPVDVFDVPVRSIGGTTVVYDVTSSDVRFFRSKVDADQNPRTYNGWNLNLGADNFVMCQSGFINMLHKDQTNGSGVRFRGAKNWHITCSDFIDILNDAEGTTATTRANAFWSNNNADGVPEGHGIVSSCTIRNLQSNSEDQEGEVFTSQEFDGSTGNIELLGNWCVDAGKRLLKSQHPNNIVMGTFFHWDTGVGPLGQRKMLNIINNQLDGDFTTSENNYFKMAGDGRWESCFTVKPRNIDYQDLEYSCNDIEVITEPVANFYGRIFIYQDKDLTSPDNQNSLPGGTASNNNVYGLRPNYFFQFSAGYEDDGTVVGLDISGNTISTVPILGMFEGSPGTPLPP